MINVLIPMAGRGSRFEQAGYSLPKPLVDVQGHPMISRVIENLGIEARYIFLCLKEHGEIPAGPTFTQILRNQPLSNCSGGPGH